MLEEVILIFQVKRFCGKLKKNVKVQDMVI